MSNNNLEHSLIGCYIDKNKKKHEFKIIFDGGVEERNGKEIKDKEAFNDKALNIFIKNIKNLLKKDYE